MRRSPLKRMSSKRQGQRQERLVVVGEAMRRAGYRCEAVDAWPEIECEGGLDVDEIVPRGVRPGGHLQLDDVQVLCRRHHTAKHDNPHEAVKRGFRIWSWDDPRTSPREAAQEAQAAYLRGER